jgi:hypothetical protein
MMHHECGAMREASARFIILHSVFIVSSEMTAGLLENQ